MKFIQTLTSIWSDQPWRANQRTIQQKVEDHWILLTIRGTESGRIRNRRAVQFRKLTADVTGNFGRLTDHSEAPGTFRVQPEILCVTLLQWTRPFPFQRIYVQHKRQWSKSPEANPWYAQSKKARNGRSPWWRRRFFATARWSDRFQSDYGRKRAKQTLTDLVHSKRRINKDILITGCVYVNCRK